MEDQDAQGAPKDDAGSGSRRRARVRSGTERSGPAHPDRRRDPLPTRPALLPPLPASFDAALDRALAELDLALPAPARAAIDAHVRLLVAWNRAINLTAIDDPPAIATRHVADSLSAVPVLLGARARRVLDVGSGGGFPGLPLAVALPEAEVRLVESIGKKAAFLRTVVEALGLGARVAVAPVRAEQLASGAGERERWDAVVARAVAELPVLAELAFPLLRPGGILVAWKRAGIEPELDAARRAVGRLGGGRIEVTDPRLSALPDHRLVVVTKAGATDLAYPRDPAERRRRPL